MNTDTNQDSNRTKTFVFDILVGSSGLLGVGYAGYEMGVFTGVAGGLPFLFIICGVLLGVSSVAMMESKRFRTLFERPVLGIVLATVIMGVVAGMVWVVSQAGPTRAMYTVLGIIAAALVTRISVFVRRSLRSTGAT